MTAWLKKIFKQFATHLGSKAASSSAQDMRNTAEAFKTQGNEHYAKGELDQAAARYRQAIEADPGYADAYNNLGAIYLRQNRLDEALVCYQKAVVLNPDLANAHHNLTALLAEMEHLATTLANPAQREMWTSDEMDRLAALFNAGRYLEVENWARLACEQHPDSGLSWKMLGGSLLMQGKDALSSLRKAAELLPDDVDAHNNLGNALKDLGRLEDAVASYRRALEINPGFSGAHYNLGNALKDLGQLNDAAASYTQALALKPDHVETHNNLGVTLQALGQLEGAVASYTQALAFKPSFLEAHFNLGAVLRELGQLDNALASCRLALEIKPDYAEAHSNLGNVLHDLGQFDGALASYAKALEINPDYDKAHHNLGNVLRDIGQIDGAVASYTKALEINPDFVVAQSNLLLTLNYIGSGSCSSRLEEARRFGRMVEKNARARFSVWPCMAAQPERLRVGLVSGDFNHHPVGYFLQSLLTKIDPTHIDLIAYSTNRKEDELTARIKAGFAAWNSLTGLSDEAAAHLIHTDGVHILIDLSGHTAHNRLPLFAWKPAPVQVSWLGYFATTGVAAMDFFIADPWTAPEAEESHFTEKIQRLPETYLCFSPPEVNMQVAPLPALTVGHITFGCFNNLTKMNDAVVALWARVMQAVPESRLFLKTKQIGEASVRQSVAHRFAAHGIIAERLILEGSAPRAELLAAYHRVDIAFDPFPYPGGATSIEALWMGVPVLTLAGDCFLSHLGESIMQNAGLPDWIAVDADDYIARAVLHAGDLQSLAMLRYGLRRQVLASPLFDAPRFARHFEAALQEMWQKWCIQHKGRL